MKNALLTAFILLLTFQLPAQVAQWIIPPHYDSIYFATCADLIVTDSLDRQVYWDHHGHRLFATAETIHPFSEGYAVTTNGSGAITGFFDTKGHYTSFVDNGVSVANDYPYFSNGYLIVKRGSYYVADTQGTIHGKKYIRIYPFSNGYAVCRDYEFPQKEKGVARFLIDLDRNEVPLVYRGKNLNPADIDFISSVSDENTGFIIMKKSVYIFNGTTKQVEPLYFPYHNSNSKPPQAKIDGDLSVSPDLPGPIIYAKCGKSDQITIHFDSNLVPISIYYNTEKHLFSQKEPSPAVAQSPLSPTEQEGLFGLAWERKPVLPAQFDNVIRCFDNYAFVQHSGRQGLLQVLNDETFNFTINNGNDIAFRHQYFETTIRIDMSTALDPEKIDLEIDPSSGCQIDKISKQTKGTTSGNRAEYNCQLTIPEAITEELSEFEYPIQINYDNIKLFPFSKKVKAWHYKSYDIVINDNEKEFDNKNNLFSFPYSISAERFSNEETFPFELTFLPDTLDIEIQQISAMRGVCKVPVSELNDGTNYLFIQLTEQGCPPITFPFAITYTKPSAKNKNKPTKREDVQIKKKTMQELEYDLEFPGL